MQRAGITNGYGGSAVGAPGTAGMNEERLPPALAFSAMISVSVFLWWCLIRLVGAVI